MSQPPSIRPPFSRPLRAVWLALGVTLLLVSAASAAVYIIDTNDSSITDWTTPGIVAFGSDPAGDVLDPGGAPGFATDDIVKAWVGSATIPPPTGQNQPSLAFRVETASLPPASQLLRSVAAFLDCDRNGIENERQDRIVIYQTTGPRVDEVTIYTGDQIYGLIPSAVLPKLLGQRVSNNLEWAVAIAELPINGNEPPELGKVVDCKHKVNIRIAMMAYVTETQHFVELDTLLPAVGWDIDLGVPLSATLTISRPVGTPDVTLNWTPTGQTEQYEVQRSVQPYDGYASWTTTPALTAIDADVNGQPEPAYYYLVRGLSGGVQTVEPSNKVGVFKFNLVVGT